MIQTFCVLLTHTSPLVHNYDNVLGFPARNEVRLCFETGMFTSTTTNFNVKEYAVILSIMNKKSNLKVIFKTITLRPENQFYHSRRRSLTAAPRLQRKYVLILQGPPIRTVTHT